MMYLRSGKETLFSRENREIFCDLMLKSIQSMQRYAKAYKQYITLTVPRHNLEKCSYHISLNLLCRYHLFEILRLRPIKTEDKKKFFDHVAQFTSFVKNNPIYKKEINKRWSANQIESQKHLSFITCLEKQLKISELILKLVKDMLAFYSFTKDNFYTFDHGEEQLYLYQTSKVHLWLANKETKKREFVFRYLLEEYDDLIQNLNLYRQDVNWVCCGCPQDFVHYLPKYLKKLCDFSETAEINHE